MTTETEDALLDKIIQSHQDARDRMDLAMVSDESETFAECVAEEYANSQEVKKRHWLELLALLSDFDKTNGLDALDEKTAWLFSKDGGWAVMGVVDPFNVTYGPDVEAIVDRLLQHDQ